jgi:hypothetical protein
MLLQSTRIVRRSGKNHPILLNELYDSLNSLSKLYNESLKLKGQLLIRL